VSFRAPLLLALGTIPIICAAAGEGYLGRDVCAGCHKNIAATHVRTRMARTWRGTNPEQLPVTGGETRSEGPPPDIQYAVMKTRDGLQYQVQMPGRPKLEFPVEAMVGGDRHGISFLIRVSNLEGLAVPGSPLIEARYFHSSVQGRLAFSLGFPEDKPVSYETAMGRVLTPYLKQRCLSCHGAPRMHGTRLETGVGCESCHGPGQPHLAALSQHKADLGILNPKKLPVPEQMRPCSQCHAGSTVVEDPMPDDLLISDQVTALKNSECWRNTGGRITCVNCHNPHEDASSAILQARAVRTCLGCHSLSIQHHAGICPVNRTSGCVSCHMANETRGAFVIAEHWIRVQPGQEGRHFAANPAWRSTIEPSHLYLRMMVLETRGQASTIRQQLLAGGSFFDLARANSVDRSSAANGGYLGDLTKDELDPAWAAAALKLEPGEVSDVIEANGRYIILQRMPRTFREEAEIVFNKAMALRKQGRQQESINELLAALKIYPHLLRALTWLGAAYGEAGNPQVSAGILSLATRLYPNDGGAHYNLGLAYGAMGNPDEIAEYKRTLEIDPDYVLAYLNWGAALFAKGEYEEAAQVYRKGIAVNPLFPLLHYNLSNALEQQHKDAEAESEMALALKIDPNVGKH
jgi:predicted CXXCH cytochrome family protein